MSFSNALLAQKISDLIDYWSSFSVEYADWLGGTISGGPGADGQYPLTDYTGTETLVKSPAKLQDDVDNITTGATAQANAAAASAAAASTSETNASASAATATAQAALADADRVAAELAETNSTNAAVTSTAQANLATDRAGYAQEWAQAVFETPVSVAAGGDGSTDFSALHWATVAEGFAGSVDSGLYGQLAQTETITGWWTIQDNKLSFKETVGGDRLDIFHQAGNFHTQLALGSGDWLFYGFNNVQFLYGMTVDIRDAGSFRIRDLGDTAYVTSSHDGVDFNVVGTLTTDINVTGITSFNVPALAATGAVTGSNLNVANWDTAYGWGNHAGLYSLAAHNHAGVYEPADATILKDADIGVTVQAYDATYVVDADIGVTVAAFSHSHSDYLPNSGVAVHTGDIDFNNILGDRITLWGTHDNAASYAIGIESGTMYFKADAQYRWYFDVNADLGVSDTMELTPNALYVNTQILAGNGYGSAGTPSFTSTQDANSGMYVKSSDTLGFSTGGVERVTIDVNGLTMVAAGADLILGNNSLTAENISSSAGAAPLKIGTGTGTPMVWGQYCALGRTYSAARTGLANNAYVDTDDAVSGQWRHLVTHGSYGHTILEMAAGAYYFYGKSESVTSGAIVTKNQYAQLDSGNGFKVATTGNVNPGAGWSSLSRDMLHIDGKEAIDGNDTWLRINMNGDFTSGTYLPTAWHFANVMKRYNKGAYLYHQGTGYAASGAGGVTFSTSARTGGVSGDIWFQYT